MKKRRRKNTWPAVIFGMLTLALAFRLTPFLFPIEKADIRDERFHSVKFYDRHGNLLQEVLSESSRRSVHVDIEHVSSYFLNAIVAAEDKHFFRHNGVDHMAVLRAMYQNLRAKRVVSGASTITLQLARLIHPGERTFLKKLQEMYQAYRIETGMDKNAILEEYVNRLPMGGNLYGIESAAKSYFGVSSADLTLAQSTFLASIPNSPNRLNPYHNMKEIKKRQRTVLKRMVEQSMIPEGRLEGALKEDILLKPQSASFQSPHFVFHLMNTLPEDAHTVRTTIDVELQQVVSEQVNKGLSRLKAYNVTNAAAILLDNYSGEVLAYVGSADYFRMETDGNVDGVMALRQPGSTLKPFLYVLAMEEGLNPASLISDVPTHYAMPTGIYSPENYSKRFHGPVRVREALANSLNVPAVRTLTKIGIDRFLDRLHAYGFNSLTRDEEFYGLGLALGGGEVSLYELAQAYMCLARMGDFCPIRETIEINVIRQGLPGEIKRISTQQFNYLVADILSDAFARTAEFGFDSILNLPFPCCVKTGTSFRFCDNWTIGFTQDYTLGIWVGNFDHTPMMKVSGVSGAGPIFAHTMNMLYNEREWPEKYEQPEGLVRVSICPLSGKKPGASCTGRMEELIPERDLAAYEVSSCDMHRQRGDEIATVMPIECRTWAEGLGLKTDYGQKSEFQITNPKNGAVYHRMSNLAPEFQSIHIKLDSDDTQHKVKWLLNEEPIRETQQEHGFLWQIRPGDFVLTAISDEKEQRTSRVAFSVR